MIRTEFGRFPRQVSGYSLEHLLPENGADLARFLVGTEGTLGVVTGGDGRAWCASPQAVALAVLGYPGHAGRRGRRARPAAAPPGGPRGHGRAAGGRLPGPPRRRPPCPALPRGQAWLFVETAGDTEAEARAAASELIADAGCLDALVVTGPAARRAVAHPRGRRRPGRPHPGRRAGLARLGGRRRPAAAPRRLPAGLRAR